MAKRKALSAAEKRSLLLELFYESSDVFQLKDIERLAPKEKGIVLQSVKGTLQELVDSGLVSTNKISGSVYFWAFPSQSLKTTKRLLKESEEQNIQLTNKIKNTEKKLQTAKELLKDAGDVAAAKREIEELQQEKQQLKLRVAAVTGEVDYKEIAAKEQDTKKIIEATNRWTDNIFSIKTWCKRKFDKEDRELDKAFGIPDDLDYLNI